jgi:hypothetical protein
LKDNGQTTVTLPHPFRVVIEYGQNLHEPDDDEGDADFVLEGKLEEKRQLANDGECVEQKVS